MAHFRQSGLPAPLSPLSVRRPAPVPAHASAPVLTRRIVDGVPGEPLHDEPFDATLAFCAEAPDRMALTIVPEPHPETIAALATSWALHPLLVEDLQEASQRPKLERYDDTLFVVARSARYLDAKEEVEFSEFHLLMRPDALAVICQDGRLPDGAVLPRGHRSSGAAAGEPSGAAAEASVIDASTPLLRSPELLRLGPEAMLYQLLDTIVDGYLPVLDGLHVDREQIERQVFSGDAAATERIYHLSQEVIDLLHASTALSRVLLGLERGAEKYGIDEQMQAYLLDVADHLSQVIGDAKELRDALSQILQVNATLVAQRQNDDMKKISGWAAILFAPTLIGAIYGMNFDAMPELHWTYGYPLAVGAMVGLGAALYGVFRWKKWM
ncbi:magnesium and cobalt transport protein CorA [Brachybacterium sp. DNPG3]